MTATTTTTIRGVSIFSRQRTRKADLFDIALSSEGIAIQRPGQSEQHMTWERIAQWEIQERPGCVVLTLRGGGSVTPLMVKGWTLEDLETVMREATTGATDPPPAAAVTSEAVTSEAVTSRLNGPSSRASSERGRARGGAGRTGTPLHPTSGCPRPHGAAPGECS